MDFVNSDKLLFICASPAGAGYRLGRIISCLDNVYWYTSKGNGMHPWSVIRKNPMAPSIEPLKVKGRKISKFHYDRKTNLGIVPLVGERVEKYWNKDDLDYYYSTVWNQLMIKSGADEIVKNNFYLTWVVHDTPRYLLDRFPNSKIINLIDNDTRETSKRYMTTTAHFPVEIENNDIKPIYFNEYAKSLNQLKAINGSPTYKDYWAWTNYNIEKYDESLNEEYFSSIFKNLSKLATEKNFFNLNCLTVSWNDLKITDIIQFCNSNHIKQEYTLLLV